jgi:cytochrome o ubiquinol oxidase subunit 2
MKKLSKIVPWIMLAALLVAGATWYLRRYAIPVMQPAGVVGHKERNLIVFCAALSVAVVVPVFSLLGYFAWHYREGNHKAKYNPEQDGSPLAETVWWLIPTFLMAIIAVVTWQSSYALDPYKPLSNTKKTLHIQVVAMDWKWLFIYPGQHVASVNEVTVPVGTPVDFEITSDTVMTSFWAPALGGQMYAMPGMSTHLNLEADKMGGYNGVAANISGKGFADMKFKVYAMAPTGYQGWIDMMQTRQNTLDTAQYAKLAKPGVMQTPQYYGRVENGLYDTIMMKYMMPTQANTTDNTEPAMSGMSM